jgi:acyl-CoA synthetase (AMP-forming)/AMP-acid ligase II
MLGEVRARQGGEGQRSGHTTVYQAFASVVRDHPDRDLLQVLPQTARRYQIEARSFSYGQAAGEVESLIERYRALGLAPGHRVGLMLDNRPAFFFHWLALNALGASAVPLSSEWRSAELQYAIEHSAMRLAVVPPVRERDVALAAAGVASDVVVSTPDLASSRRVVDDSVAPRPDSLSDEMSECALLYTSGTTGKPKGCVLTNQYYLCAGEWYVRVGGLCELNPGADRLLTPLPMSHMNAMAFSTMAMILTGSCIVPLDRFHPTTWWDSVRASGATIVHYLGVMPAMLLGAPAEPSERKHRVRFGFGAGVSPRLHAQFESRFGFPLLEAWAMTETGAGAVMIANQEPRKVGTACIGRPSSWIDARVITEEGAEATAGETGELLVRCAGGEPGRGFFREYLKDPLATAEAWADGYFHTGDLVCRDADGDLHFVDRKKNVIRRSGENISAVEVEGVLSQHPRVASVGVAAVPDELRGDEVMACVVARGALSRADHAALARELAEFCLQRLAYFKAPGYVAFCDGLPLTPTEKIQRAKLKELASSLHGEERSIDLRALKKPVQT